MKQKTKFKQTEIGKIPEDWEETKIGMQLKIKNGKTDSQDAVEKGKYPLFDRSQRIKRSDKFLFDFEAIIIPGEGKEFIPRYFKGKFDLHQRAYTIWKDKGDINIKFIYYWILQNRKYLSNIAVGSTVKSLRLNHLENFPLGLPNHQEQIAIAKILSSLDDKIELNNKMNKTFESIGQVIFKQWFVDGKKDDWEISTIGKELKTILGGTPDRTKPEYWNGDINWINSGKVNEFRITEPSEKITVEGLNKSATSLLPAGSVVLAITGATLGQVSRLEIDSCANQSVIGVLENDKLSSEYIYFLIKNKINDLIGSRTGGAQQHINKRNVEDYSLLIPDKRTLNNFNKLAKSIFKQISINCFQNKTLSQIRDALLPKLMSGKIRVKNPQNPIKS